MEAVAYLILYNPSPSSNMEKLTFNRQFVVEKKPEEWWQIAGKAMTKFYDKNCYWVFWKHKRIDIERAWAIAQNEGDKDFTHLLNNIKRG